MALLNNHKNWFLYSFGIMAALIICKKGKTLCENRKNPVASYSVSFASLQCLINWGVNKSETKGLLSISDLFFIHPFRLS
jgi:hypothetical protein